MNISTSDKNEIVLFWEKHSNNVVYLIMNTFDFNFPRLRHFKISEKIIDGLAKYKDLSVVSHEKKKDIQDLLDKVMQEVSQFILNVQKEHDDVTTSDSRKTYLSHQLNALRKDADNFSKNISIFRKSPKYIALGKHIYVFQKACQRLSPNSSIKCERKGDVTYHRYDSAKEIYELVQESVNNRVLSEKTLRVSEKTLRNSVFELILSFLVLLVSIWTLLVSNSCRKIENHETILRVIDQESSNFDLRDFAGIIERAKFGFKK